MFKLHSSLNVGFVQQTITKMADKVAAYVYAVMVTLTQCFFNRFFQNFLYGLLPSDSPSSLNMGFVR